MYAITPEARSAAQSSAAAHAGWPLQAAPDDRNRDPDERRARGERIAQVVAGIGAHHRTAGRRAERLRAAHEPPLERHGHDKHAERPGSGHLVRRPDFAHGFDGDAECRRDKQTRHSRRRERLGFSVTVGVIRIGRARGYGQATPDHDRREDIGATFNRVGDQGIGVAEDTRRELRAGQPRVGQQPELCNADSLAMVTRHCGGGTSRVGGSTHAGNFGRDTTVGNPGLWST